MAQPEWEKVRSADNLFAIGNWARDIVDKICRGAIPRSNGYVKKTVVRKLICACPHVWNAADWGSVRRADLQAWTPDETKVLEEFPETATAESISMLLFGRPDWGLLVSMWGCMWKPAAHVLDKHGVDNITPAHAKAICAAAAALHEETGLESTPTVAVQWLAKG